MQVASPVLHTRISTVWACPCAPQSVLAANNERETRDTNDDERRMENTEREMQATNENKRRTAHGEREIQNDK